jgi:hypothetical protein
MAGLKWLPEALDDIQRLYDFLHKKDISAAKRAATCSKYHLVSESQCQMSRADVNYL